MGEQRIDYGAHFFYNIFNRQYLIWLRIKLIYRKQDMLIMKKRDYSQSANKPIIVYHKKKRLSEHLQSDSLFSYVYIFLLYISFIIS